MSDKARLFRSLLLEPLECRSVFSVDGYDVWQFSDPNFEFDRSEPAQYPSSEYSSNEASLRNHDFQHSDFQHSDFQHSDFPSNDFLGDNFQWNLANDQYFSDGGFNDAAFTDGSLYDSGFYDSSLNSRNPSEGYLDWTTEYTNVIYIEMRSQRGPSQHHGRFEELDNLPLREPESEGPSIDSRPAAMDPKPSIQLPSSQTSSSQTSATQSPSSSQSAVLQSQLSTAQLSSQSQGAKFGPALNNSISTPSQLRDSSAPSFVRSDVASSNNSANNIHPSANVQNSATSFIGSANGSANGATSASGLVNPSLASLPSTSLGTSSGTTTFDFSSRLRSNDLSSASGRGGQTVDDFRFSKPMVVPADSLFDQALLERAAGIESLDNLLSGLAENYRRGRAQNGFDADHPNARSEQNLRSDSSVAVEAALSDGGMIALALNRDIAFKELEEISDSDLTENKAWIANVGIFRAFENGAVAVTEYAGLTNRVTRGPEASSTSGELPEVESDVSNSQFQPLWASTSAVLGAVMIGLRRIRKSTPLRAGVRSKE